MSKRLLVVSLAAAALLAGCQTAGRMPTPAPVAGARPDGIAVALTYRSPAELARAVDAGLDIHGVEAEQGVAFGRIPLEGFNTLKTAGMKLTVERADMGVLNNFDKGFRTYEQVASDLKRLADKFPELTQLKSAGPSWETTEGKANRQLWTMRVTGPGDASKRPAVAFTANLHARELVPVELSMALMTDLLEGYATNPEIKKLVDTRVIHFMPMANPDGHHKAESGEDQRKNTHTFSGGVGVDLNRNFPFKWNLDNGGSSAHPSSETYQGPSAVSEPETKAIKAFLSGIPNLKIGMDFHAYSNLVMWPWGWTSEPPADAALLSTIGKKLASYNKYKPIQASSLYPTSGTIRDFVYAELHVPYFTIEIGSRMDGFDPSFTRAKALVAENKPGAMWLLSIADDPSQVLRQGTKRK